jgi:hypothetical protein
MGTRPAGKLRQRWQEDVMEDLKPMRNRPVGKPRQRWQEDVMEDLKNLKSKTGRRQLRIEELGDTWLRERKHTKGCSTK